MLGLLPAADGKRIAPAGELGEIVGRLMPRGVFKSPPLHFSQHLRGPARIDVFLPHGNQPSRSNSGGCERGPACAQRLARGPVARRLGANARRGLACETRSARTHRTPAPPGATVRQSAFAAATLARGRRSAGRRGPQTAALASSQAHLAGVGIRPPRDRGNACCRSW